MDSGAGAVNIRNEINAIAIGYQWGSQRVTSHAMPPSRLQYFFAQPWLSNTWLVTVPTICVVLAVRASGASFASLTDWSSALWLVAIIALALPAGYLLALVSGCLIFPPLFRRCGLRNGAPFHNGDRVRILVGQHRDKIVHVCEVRESWNQVRVELSEQDQKNVTDVFSDYEVCRET